MSQDLRNWLLKLGFQLIDCIALLWQLKSTKRPCKWTESPLLSIFKDEIITLLVRRIPMMFEIFLNGFLDDVARAPCTVTRRPERLSPVAGAQQREFLLQDSRRAPLKAVNLP